jgi:tRNA A-37 threonylcarbamoyl transferase component Bud32
MSKMNAPVGIGEVIAGKYEVERPLAAGGMGIVVVARHIQLDKLVAIKFMLPDLLRAGIEPDALERFVREGRAAVRLRGENVARVHDVDMLPDGMPYMVMEYLEGMDLSRHLRKHGPLPLGESVDYVLQACVAMAEAHLSGIVHRDLKPSNLFLTRRPDGTPLIKVLDFGISKLYTDPGAQSTQTAVIMGSPSFMAPEQAKSARNADVRSDIWSLGVILYECTSKQLPYENQASTAAVLAQLIYESPRPLGQVAPNLPAAFCKVVDTCLQKDPGQRYQSIGELASALAPFASAVGRQATASIHAIIGGAAGPAAPGPAAPGPAVPGPAVPWQAERSAPFEPAKQRGSNDDTEADLPQADTGLALASPSRMQGGAMPGQAPAAAHGGAWRSRRGGVGEGELESDTSAVADAQLLDLAIDVHEVRRELSPSRPEPAPRRNGRVWLDGDRIAELATLLALTTLTGLVLLSGGGPAWLDGLNDVLHRFGYQISGRTGEHVRLLIGPAFQIAIPLTLAFVLSHFGMSLAAAVPAWWIGHNIVHIARSMGGVFARTTPITGEDHPWSYWFRVWGLASPVDNVVLGVHYLGVGIMIAVLLLLLRQLLLRL